jgi:hypothetical protein
MILSFTITTSFLSCLHNVSFVILTTRIASSTHKSLLILMFIPQIPSHLTPAHWELQDSTLTHELPSSIPYQFRILKLTQRVLNLYRESSFLAVV